ncbi:MAG: type II toxin-antitoxin system death-on-curing family toxin [Spirochaetia bacterium]|nr:MAG: type II toxin-antitoxin system death-on-curing family toxin [Spirochaetia bacterium]
MKIKELTIAEVEYIAFYLANSTRFPNVLESCLITPFASFGGKTAYRGVIGKSSMLFYLMIKNHPFQNGNKRIAMTTLMYFLYENGKWLRVDNQELYNFAKWVATSNPKLKIETVKAVEKFIEMYIIKL